MRSERSVLASVWPHQCSDVSRDRRRGLLPETDNDRWGKIQRAWLEVQSQVRRGKCWRETESDWEVSWGAGEDRWW